MADLNNPSQEVELVDQETGYRAKPTSAGALPVVTTDLAGNPTAAATESTLSKLTIPQGATLGANTQTLIGGAVSLVPPAYTVGQISPFSVTPAGQMRVYAQVASNVFPGPTESSVSGKLFAFPTITFSVSTTESDSIYFVNPSGSGKNVLFWKNWFEVNTSGRSNRSAFYLNPTVTVNGTAIAINNLFMGGGNTTIALAYSAPTVTVRGTLIYSQTIWQAASPYLMNTEFGWVIPPGTSILMTDVASGVSTTVAARWSWAEVDV